MLYCPAVSTTLKCWVYAVNGLTAGRLQEAEGPVWRWLTVQLARGRSDRQDAPTRLLTLRVEMLLVSLAQ